MRAPTPFLVLTAVSAAALAAFVVLAVQATRAAERATSAQVSADRTCVASRRARIESNWHLRRPIRDLFMTAAAARAAQSSFAREVSTLVRSNPRLATLERHAAAENERESRKYRRIASTLRLLPTLDCRT